MCVQESSFLKYDTFNRPYWTDILLATGSNLMYLTSYDALPLIELVLYSHHKLGTKLLDINVSIVALPLVSVHQLHLCKHFQERGEKDMSNTNSVHQQNWTSLLPALPSLLVHMSTSILIQFYCPNNQQKWLQAAHNFLSFYFLNEFDVVVSIVYSAASTCTVRHIY